MGAPTTLVFASKVVSEILKFFVRKCVFPAKGALFVLFVPKKRICYGGKAIVDCVFWRQLHEWVLVQRME